MTEHTTVRILAKAEHDCIRAVRAFVSPLFDLPPDLSTNGRCTNWTNGLMIQEECDWSNVPGFRLTALVS